MDDPVSNPPKNGFLEGYPVPGRGRQRPDALTDEQRMQLAYELLGGLGGGAVGGVAGGAAGGLVSPIAPYTALGGAGIGARRGYVLGGDQAAFERGNMDAERQPGGQGFYGKYR